MYCDHFSINVRKTSSPILKLPYILIKDAMKEKFSLYGKIRSTIFGSRCESKKVPVSKGEIMGVVANDF